MKGEILPPLSASVHARSSVWRLGPWAPLFLLLLIPILIVILIVALPLLFVASLIFRFSLWRSLRGVKGVFVAPRGSRASGENPEERGFIDLDE